MFEAIGAEIAFSHYVQSFANISLDYFFLVITQLGNPVLWLSLSAFLYWQGEEKKSVFLSTSLLFTSAFVGLLKPAIGRLRPPESEFRVLITEIQSQFAMPSGHATTIAGIFGYYWEKFAKSARVIGLVIVLLVLASRVYLGAHYIGDVIVGGLFGFLIGRIVHVIEQNYSKIKFNKKILLEEIGLVATIVISIIISLALREFSLGTIFFGYFAGVFAFKLLNLDSEKLSGKKLWIKEIPGFVGLGILSFFALNTNFMPELLFVAGAWISFVYPFIYLKVSKKTG